MALLGYPFSGGISKDMEGTYSPLEANDCGKEKREEPTRPSLIS